MAELNELVQLQAANVPGIITQLGVRQGWYHMWELAVLQLLLPVESTKGTLLLDQQSLVTVYDCSQSEAYGGSSSTQMPLYDAIRTFGGFGKYIKDWHIDKALVDKSKGSVCLPFPLQNDWLNWYWKHFKNDSDDYSFLYLGEEGSGTEVHHDVCCSYSWSLNLVGRKKWTLWRPKVSSQLFPPPPKGEGFSWSYAKSTPTPQLHAHPPQQLISAGDCIELIQETGELIFVPSGWYHTVVNLPERAVMSHCQFQDLIDTVLSIPSFTAIQSTLAVTASINRNWFNGFSIVEVWLFLCRELHSVRREISDLLQSDEVGAAKDPMAMNRKDWNRHSEILLRCNSAMNVSEFVELLTARLLLWEEYLSVTRERPCESSARDSNVWKDLFCPKFFSQKMFSAEDAQLFRWMEGVEICQEREQRNVLSSSFADPPDFLEEIGRSVLTSREELQAFIDSHFPNVLASIRLPLSALRFEIVEVLRVFVSLASSPTLCQYLADILLNSNDCTQTAENAINSVINSIVILLS